MEATIHLSSSSNYADITLKEDDGSVTKKMITMDNLRDIFKSQEPSRYHLQSPLFFEMEEKEYIQGLLYGEVSNSHCAGIYFVPGDKRLTNVYGEKAMIPNPSTLFVLFAKNGRIQKSLCFAVKEKDIYELKKDTVLYSFPFGNVMPSDAHICWGNNRLADMSDYISLRYAISVFFGSESNKDYVNMGRSYASKYGEYEQFLNTIKDFEEFPEDAYVVSPYKQTLGSLFKTFNDLLKEVK